MECISVHSLPSASIIPVSTTVWCPELSWWRQPPTEFEITGKLCGLSTCRICVYTCPKYIRVDALTICPAGLDASCPKLVPIRQNDFQRPTDAVVICRVHVGRGGNLILCGLVRNVFGEGAAGTTAATATTAVLVCSANVTHWDDFQWHRNLDELSCIQLEASSLLLAVIILLITWCLITPPCYELGVKERGEILIWSILSGENWSVLHKFEYVRKLFLARWCLLENMRNNVFEI